MFACAFTYMVLSHYVFCLSLSYTFKVIFACARVPVIFFSTQTSNFLALFVENTNLSLLKYFGIFVKSNLPIYPLIYFWAAILFCWTYCLFLCQCHAAFVRALEQANQHYSPFTTLFGQRQALWFSKENFRTKLSNSNSKSLWDFQMDCVESIHQSEQYLLFQSKNMEFLFICLHFCFLSNTP